MMSRRGRLMVACGLCLGLASLFAAPVRAQAEAQKVVIHLSHYTDDLHATMMALKLGKAMAAKGAEVTLLLDLEGVRLVDADQPQDLRWGPDTPVATHYDAFVKAGGKLLVCPHCAAAAGVEKAKLRPGARIGEEMELADALLAADKVLDY